MARMIRPFLMLMLALATLLAGGCAALQPRDPLTVTVVGVESLPGEGLELRMLVRLRVQNPNDQPIDYNGVSVEMTVQGRGFATGVSDAGGTVPRFGETVIAVPVSVSALRMAGQVMGFINSSSSSERRGRIVYEMNGKLAGSAFSSVHFKSAGELNLPTAGAAAASD
ncbi:LEA type 2 family protein [Roseateles violae]|uniref:LEA type 2 family protein n=1 Tax=Roseateles violae TaxID=3058042 RepID=A0ABT8DUE1_9BURK|nr:LEA type 2 family protein [Pelomonas sp. PFR6]MDN3919934.1 LEA type 2 family protein [Pelomonas sp. PFR6]